MNSRYIAFNFDRDEASGRRSIGTVHSQLPPRRASNRGAVFFGIVALIFGALFFFNYLSYERVKETDRVERENYEKVSAVNENLSKRRDEARARLGGMRAKEDFFWQEVRNRQSLHLPYEYEYEFKP